MHMEVAAGFLSVAVRQMRAPVLNSSIAWSRTMLLGGTVHLLEAAAECIWMAAALRGSSNGRTLSAILPRHLVVAFTYTAPNLLSALSTRQFTTIRLKASHPVVGIMQIHYGCAAAAVFI